MDPLAQKALQEHLWIFLFALFLSLITCFIAWYRSYFKLPPFDPSKIKLNLGHVLGAFFIYFFVAFTVSYLAFFVIGRTSLEFREQLYSELNAVKAWVNLGAMALVLIALFFYLKFLNEETRVSVLGDGTHKLKNFCMGIISWLISFPLVIAVSQLASALLIAFQWQTEEQMAVQFFKSTMNNPVVFGVTCLFVILIIPLIEEIIFRGFLQNWFAKFIGRKAAVFTTALIFSFFHFSILQGYGNIEIIASLFVLASFLGFIYFRQNSIYASWGLHATFNGLNVLFMSLSKGVS